MMPIRFEVAHRAVGERRGIDVTRWQALLPGCAALLLASCATTPAPGNAQAARDEGSIEMFEMHPDPLVDARTDFSPAKVTNGSIRGPAQGPNGRVASWLERSGPDTWTGFVYVAPKQAVPEPKWQDPCLRLVEGAWWRVPVEAHVDGSRVAGPTIDLGLSRIANGFRIQGSWLGSPRDVEVTSEAIVVRGTCTSVWTRIEPGLYRLDRRPQIRVRLEGAAADPATAPFPEAAFAVLLSGL
jgi:hypothetical protein